jgi:hypothetical protein
MRINQPVYTLIMHIYYIVIRVASYMFRLSIMAIFREVLFERILHRTLEQFTN